MNKKFPVGRPVTDPGKPATYTGPTGTPRIQKEPITPKMPDEIPGQLVEVSDMPKIERDGMTITKSGVAMIVAAVIQWGVPDDMSVSQAARRLGIHRHTLTAIIRNYEENGQIGAIKILDGVDINDFNDIVADTLMSSFFDRQSIVEAANGELRRRLEEETESLTVKNLIDIQKTNDTMTLNAAKFIMELEQGRNRVENKSAPMTNDAIGELKEIFSTAAKRLSDSEKKNRIING